MCHPDIASEGNATDFPSDAFASALTFFFSPYINKNQNQNAATKARMLNLPHTQNLAHNH